MSGSRSHVSRRAGTFRHRRCLYAYMIRGWMLLLLYLAIAPLRVSPEFERARLTYQVRPVYPKLAREARIQGTVRLAALIDRIGEVESLRLIYGHPFLVNAAMDAVKQWRYRPMIVSGVPVSVATEIDVNVSFNAGERDPIVHV